MRLFVARVVSLALLVLTLALFLASIPVYYDQLQTVCPAGETCPFERLTAEQAEALEVRGLSTSTWAAYRVSVEVVFFLIWFAVGVAIFWLGSDVAMALLVALFLVTFGASFGSGPDALAAASPAWRPLFTLVETTGSALLLLFLYLFPNGRFVPGWTRWTALAWTAGWALGLLFPGSPFDMTRWPVWLIAGWYAGGLGSGLFAQVYRFRRVSGRVERQQTEWVVFGTATTIILFVAVILLLTLVPGLRAPGTPPRMVLEAIVPLAFMCVPLSIGSAVLRYRLYDIDIIINRTLVYSALTAALALVYTGAVVLFERLFQALFGQGHELAIIASTLCIAALFTPLRRRIQADVDRRFYRHKYNAEQVLAAFAATARDEVDLDRLSDALVAVVEETVQPTHASLWLHDDRLRLRDVEL